MGNIENGKVITDDLKFVDTVDPALHLVRGDLLYNRTNSLDLIGKVGLFLGENDSPVSFASYLVRLRTVEDSIPNFISYLLNTGGVIGIARSNAFVAIGQCNLNPTRYGQISVAIPPKMEQEAIVAFLDHETTKLDTLIEKSRRSIDLMREHRTALISAAVTGKIDVREAT
jgi:type I restriction enzyme S subunit